MKKARLKRVRLLVGVSGGCDSVALLHALVNVQGSLSLDLIVAHVHHGPLPTTSQDSANTNYRDQSARFVQELALGYQLPCEVRYYVGTPLKSEQQLREVRRGFLKEIAVAREAQGVVFAHHRDDLLETRLMRLVRGVGPQGLDSMPLHSGLWVRPWLGVSRQNIQTYARGHGLKWLEDPSNKDKKYFRNWVRQAWLRSLENARPGSLESLSRSLDLLASQAQGDALPKDIYTDRGIDLVPWVELSFRDQRRVIAGYLRQNQIREYTLAHVDEIIKRLESQHSRGNFRLLKRNWHCDARRLRVLPE